MYYVFKSGMLAFFFYNNHFISMFTPYICISFKNLVKNEGGEISP